jgi:hypothetical protein
MLRRGQRALGALERAAASMADSRVKVRRVGSASCGADLAAAKPGVRVGRTEAMAAAFEPAAVERGWYEWWERSGFFKPQPSESQPPVADGARGAYTMLLPPPNVTVCGRWRPAVERLIESARVRRAFSTSATR